MNIIVYVTMVTRSMDLKIHYSHSYGVCDMSCPTKCQWLIMGRSLTAQCRNQICSHHHLQALDWVGCKCTVLVIMISGLLCKQS